MIVGHRRQIGYVISVFRMSIDIGGVTPSYYRSLSLQPSYAFGVIIYLYTLALLH